MNRIVVTGASGFVGQALCKTLDKNGYSVQRIIRNDHRSETKYNHTIIRKITPTTDCKGIFHTADAIIHLTTRIHVMNDTASDPPRSFREVNTAGTLRLAEAAAKTGVRRFVFLSSIKVNGEQATNQPFDKSIPAAPQAPYAISKYEAEQGGYKIAAATAMEVIIVHLPLIYDPRVKANFLHLLNWINHGIPRLPWMRPWPKPQTGIFGKKASDPQPPPIGTCSY